MNRRELFKGLAAALVAANIPILPVEAIERLSDDKIIAWLQRQKIDLMNKIINPPCIMYEDGRIESMSTDVWQEALRHVNKLLEELV